MYYCRLSIEKYEKRTNMDAILANQEMRIGFVKYVINYFYINIVTVKLIWLLEIQHSINSWSDFKYDYCCPSLIDILWEKLYTNFRSIAEFAPWNVKRRQPVLYKNFLRVAQLYNFIIFWTLSKMIFLKQKIQCDQPYLPRRDYRCHSQIIFKIIRYIWVHLRGRHTVFMTDPWYMQCIFTSQGFLFHPFPFG